MTVTPALDNSRKPLVFISYARQDRARIRVLVQRLEAEGFHIWWDGALKGGQTFSHEIEQALLKAQKVIVVWSKASVKSDWVRDEAEHGREMGKLIPVTLDGTLPPLGFRQYHAVDLSSWVETRSTAPLTELLHALHEEARDGPAVFPQNQDRFQNIREFVIRRRTLILGGSLGIVSAAGLLYKGLAQNNSGSQPPVVMVSPFKNLSPDQNQTYFSEGITEEIRQSLSKNPYLQVLGQVSTVQANAREENLIKVARDLGVRFILGGSVRRDAQRVRISAELLEMTSEITRWSQTYDRVWTDIITLQTEIAETVNSALIHALKLRADKTLSTVTADRQGLGTKNSAAYEAYLKGRALFEKDENEAGEKAALSAFETAIRLDPNYAQARAARARSLMAMASSYPNPNQVQSTFEAAITEAHKAVNLAPDQADTQSTLALALLYGHMDARASRAAFDACYHSGNGDGSVLSRCAQYYTKIGQFDMARIAIERAVLLDPLNPLVHRSAGLIALRANRFDDAIITLKRSLALEPKLSSSNAVIGFIHLARKQFNEAKAAFDREPEPASKATGLAIVMQKLGAVSDAQSALKHLIAAFGDGVLYQQAQIMCQWGETENALTLLERARAAYDSGLLDMQVDHLLSELRSQSRFQRLSRSIGLI